MIFFGKQNSKSSNNKRQFSTRKSIVQMVHQSRMMCHMAYIAYQDNPYLMLLRDIKRMGNIVFTNEELGIQYKADMQNLTSLNQQYSNIYEKYQKVIQQIQTENNRVYTTSSFTIAPTNKMKNSMKLSQLKSEYEHQLQNIEQQRLEINNNLENIKLQNEINIKNTISNDINNYNISQGAVEYSNKTYTTKDLLGLIKANNTIINIIINEISSDLNYELEHMEFLLEKTPENYKEFIISCTKQLDQQKQDLMVLKKYFNSINIPMQNKILNQNSSVDGDSITSGEYNDLIYNNLSNTYQIFTQLTIILVKYSQIISNIQINLLDKINIYNLNSAN